MSEMSFDPQRFPRIVGVIHLPALPGSVRGGSGSDMQHVLDLARRDASLLAQGGVNGLIIENFGDVPFPKERVRSHTIAAMTLATDAVLRETGLPIGVNVLRNDVRSAVSIAALTGAAFVRANVYIGVSITDQGLIEGEAEAVQLLIKQLGSKIDVWADVDVKHAAPVAQRPVEDAAHDAVERGLAASVIVTGRATGVPVAFDDLRQVRRAIPNTPVYVGSGATIETIRELLKSACGAIVGTAFKRDGLVTNPVDLDRVRALVAAAREAE
jgi:membrane complex biogenesis BtpA family protein